MTTYPSTAPIFADADHMSDIIGYAATAHEALIRYREYFEGTGVVPLAAVKCCPDRGNGPVDGWMPELT